MRRLKDLLTAVAFIALCGVSLAGAYRVWQCELPERTPDELRELWDLLTNEDVRGYDEATLRRLAVRLETELAEGTSLGHKFRELEADLDRYDLLEGNLQALLRVWYLKHADAYGRLAGDELGRAAYVEEQFGNMSMLLEAAQYDGGGLDGFDAALRLPNMIANWLADEPPERAAHAHEFNQAVLAWLMRRQPSGLRVP